MGLQAFLKENTIIAENIKFVASNRFVEDREVEVDGVKEIRKLPIEWELKPISIQRDEEIRKSCMKKVQVTGKRGQYTPELDFDKYIGKVSAECTVYPNLNSEELQNSWGVMGAENLLKAMLLPGEYGAYMEKVQEVCGFDISMDDKVEEVKNF